MFIVDNVIQLQFCSSVINMCWYHHKHDMLTDGAVCTLSLIQNRPLDYFLLLKDVEPASET